MLGSIERAANRQAAAIQQLGDQFLRAGELALAPRCVWCSAGVEQPVDFVAGEDGRQTLRFSGADNIDRVG